MRALVFLFTFILITSFVSSDDVYFEDGTVWKNVSVLRVAEDQGSNPRRYYLDIEINANSDPSDIEDKLTRSGLTQEKFIAVMFDGKKEKEIKQKNKIQEIKKEYQEKENKLLNQIQTLETRSELLSKTIDDLKENINYLDKKNYEYNTKFNNLKSELRNQKQSHQQYVNEIHQNTLALTHETKRLKKNFELHQNALIKELNNTKYKLEQTQNELGKSYVELRLELRNTRYELATTKEKLKESQEIVQKFMEASLTGLAAKEK